MKSEQTLYREQLAAEMGKIEEDLRALRNEHAVQETEEQKNYIQHVEQLQQRHDAFKQQLAATPDGPNETWETTKNVFRSTFDELKRAIADLPHWIETGKHS